MPRAIWSGSIAFGLVNVPVKLYSAIEEKDLRFHFLHRKDDARIGYEKVCKKEGKPVPDNEIVKAYETSKGKYVYLEDDDFEAAEGKRHRTIEITDFVAYDEIDPIYFERTYFLGPAEGAEKVYALLVKAMDASGLAAVATYVMRGKQQLGCLRIREDVITLEKMHFADEVRPIDEIKVKNVKVAKQELAMATELIERFTGRFDIGKYRDEYRAALLRMVKAKARGKEIHVDREPEEAEPLDLLEALRASVAAHTGRGSGKNGTKNGRKSAEGDRNDLEALPKAELVKLAKRDGMTGYSTMNKRQLVRALDR